MSIQAVAWALEQQDDLPATVKLVLVAICNHANHIDGYCWLNTQTIADEAACVPRSVYRFVGALVRNGYIRKEKRRGADGKQRANDYWVLLDRPSAKWDWGAGLHEDDRDSGEDEAGEEITTDDVSPQMDDTTSCDRVTQTTVGETAENQPGQTVEKPSESPRPGDIGVAARESLEPSKIKPKESLRPNFSGPPRGYRPPPVVPPQPIGAAVNQSKQIFVYEGTRAWDEWVLERKRRTGLPGQPCTTTTIDGKHCTGWWFPSLFPPKTEAVEPSLATEKEKKEFADTG